MRDSDYRRAVEEAAKRGAKVQSCPWDDPLSGWSPYYAIPPNYIFTWDKLDYRISPEPILTKNTPQKGVIELMQIAPNMWVQLWGWQYEHKHICWFQEISKDAPR